MNRLEEIAYHRAEIVRLREELQVHKDAMGRLTDRDWLYRAVMEAYLQHPVSADIAGQFGISYSAVSSFRKRWRDEGGSAPRSLNRKLKAPTDYSHIIEAFKTLGTLEATGKKFGVTRERIRQIVSRYERETGESLGRPGKSHAKKELVEWECRHCGTVHRQPPAKAKLRNCGKCVSLRSRGSRLDNPVLIEEWIEARKAGSSWASIGRSAGLNNRANHLIARAIWRYLRREHRFDEVPLVWRQGRRGSVTTMLEKRWPMKESDPVVPTPMPKLMKDKCELRDELTDKIEDAAKNGLSAAQAAAALRDDEEQDYRPCLAPRHQISVKCLRQFTMKERFRCCRCGHEYEDSPRPVNNVEGRFMGCQWQTECPHCGSLYVRKLPHKQI